MKCKIVGNGFSDETIVAFLPGATSGFDALYDSWKLFSSNPNVPSIYTSIAGGPLSINSQASLTGEGEEIIYVDIPDTGLYSLQFSTVYPFDTALKFSIYDSLNQVELGVVQNTIYQFSVSNLLTLPNGRMKFCLRVHLPTAVDSIVQPNCLDSLAEIFISRHGDTNFSCWLLNAMLDTVQVIQALSEQITIYNISSGNYHLITELQGNQHNVIEISIDNQQYTNAAFDLFEDSLVIQSNAELEVWDKSYNNTWALWDFKDGSPVEYGEHITHSFEESGQYDVTLVAGNDDCTDTAIHTIVVYNDVLNGYHDVHQTGISTYYSSGYLHIISKKEINEHYHLKIYTLTGQLIYTENGFFAGKQRDVAINPTHQGNLLGVLQTKDEQFILRFPTF